MMNSMTELRVNTVMGAEIGAANGYASAQAAANDNVLKSGLVRADGTKNMYGMIGGALMQGAGVLGGMGGGAGAMGKGLGGSAYLGTSGYGGSKMTSNLVSSGMPQTGINAPGY